MTKEEKLEWLRNASDEELLKQFADYTRITSSLDNIIQSGMKRDEVMWDYTETKNEILRRMAK